MVVIAPSILADNPHTFRAQLERVETFARRIHIDLVDGEFAPSVTLNPVQLHWPKGIDVDIHVMFRDPEPHIETLANHKPNLVILHAEADGELLNMFNELKSHGVKAGVALLAGTTVESAKQLVEVADHVLVFGGKLGYFGGESDLSLLSKVAEIKKINESAEIGWDGGVNENNAKQIAESGVDVLTVGGFIQKSQKPQEAYAILGQKIY